MLNLADKEEKEEKTSFSYRSFRVERPLAAQISKNLSERDGENK